jgi:energy-converting hydrogenase B subunit Q
MADPKVLGQGDEEEATLALLVRMRVPDQPGVLHALTHVISEHHANITYVDIGGRRDGRGATYFELSDVADQDALVRDLEALPIVRVVERELPFGKIYGKRVIVIGGGAQVSQVVMGAVAEADRHNIRGERISVDTIPLVGEANLAEAVRSVPRLPRAVALRGSSSSR